MVEEFSFPIGAFLSKISVLETKDVDCGEGFNLAVLTFNPTQYLVLQPLTNHQLSISPVLSYERRRVIKNLSSNLLWSKPFINKKLQSVELKESDLGYRNQIVFIFENLSQNISFLADRSVLKVSCNEINQLETVSEPTDKVGFIRLIREKLLAFPQLG